MRFQAISEYFEGIWVMKFESIENSLNGKLLKTMFFWKLPFGPLQIFEWIHFSNASEYRNFITQFPQGHRIEHSELLFCSKNGYSGRKMPRKMAKNVTLTPPTELTRGGRVVKIWLKSYFGMINLSFE